jgi:Leucine-rich repeat (LRR) protein
MKKLYTFLVFVLAIVTSNSQIVNIPSLSFKAKLLSANTTNTIASSQPLVYNPLTRTYSVSSYNKIDTNGDGEIQLSEAQVITYLNLSSSISPNITTLTGIESFINLQYFDCTDVLSSSYTNLDLSQNTALRKLNCSVNNLTDLNISGCLELTDLVFWGNQVTSLNVAQFTALRVLECDSNNLNSLDVTQNTALEYLVCGDNAFNSIDVTQNAALWLLNCNASSLISINVSQNPLLRYLSCFSNQLTNLDLSQNPLLEELECSNNQLTSLDLSQNPLLKILYCNNNNQLLSLDVSQNTVLEELYCYNNSLTSLIATQNQALKKLRCYKNDLTHLDLTNTGLFQLDCSINQLNSLLIKNGNTTNWSILNFSSNPLLTYICADESDFTSIQQMINSYNLTNTCQLNSYCSFTPGAIFYSIQGNTRMDSNSNGCDATDFNIPNQRFTATNGTISGSFISNFSGSYSIPVIAGNHTITPVLENASYFNVSPTSSTVSFPSSNSPFTQDFCITPNGEKNDLEISIIPIEVARPGFNAYYKIVYKNKGNQMANGTFSFNFDDTLMDLVSSIPTPDGSVTNNLTWNFTNLNPFETREIDLVLNINSPIETPAVNAGNILNYTTVITGATDETPNDNTFVLNQTVVNSYDPNDKTCLEGLSISPSMVGDYVHYLIRFENTGTYPAENIVVKDDIDITKFDISTLVPLSSSHNFVTRITNTNRVEFIFENINLPFDDANNDGYVAFKIKTKPTLVVGNTFSNKANIYFDYNFPIITNNFTTTVQALVNADFEFNTVFSLSPVPTKDVLTITAKENVVMTSISIYNTLGQLVQVYTNPNETIDVSELQSGSYFIKIVSDKGSTTGKFIKE